MAVMLPYTGDTEKLLNDRRYQEKNVRSGKEYKDKNVWPRN
jgi:hypothetical protein